MIFSHRMACLLLSVFAAIFPIALAAQEYGEHASDRSPSTARKSAAPRPRSERAAGEG
jgi:hypothetical protein